MPDPVRIFVSHHHSPEEDAFTARLVADLKAGGADVWVDDEGITSDDFVRKISEGLAGRQWLILVMTPVSVQSPWVQREVNAALGEQTAGRMLGVLPLVMTPCDVQAIPILWRNLHRYDATHGYEPARDRLVQTLGLKAPQAIHTAQPLAATEAPSTPAVPVRPVGFSRVVDCRGLGDHPTIMEAIRVASPNERILIRKGVYRERLTINKPLELVGDGERGDVEIEPGTIISAVTFDASQGRLANLSIRLLGSGYGLWINSGRLEVEDCDISTQGPPTIYITGNGTNPQIRRCRIHSGSASGVAFDVHATGLIEDCEIVDNVGTGIAARDGSTPTVRRCRINHNGKWAIFVDGGAGGVYEDNDLRNNKEGAWNIAQDSLAKVTRQGNIEE